MQRRLGGILLLVLVLILVDKNVYSQAYKERFGKNRIQYKEFDWKYYESENYEVYYYNGGQELAQQTINYLEEQFGRITETIGYYPFTKTRVFLYNSVIDKQQSNVGIRGRDFSVGGQTNFVQAQLELAYSGDLASFQKKAVYVVTDMLIQEMLYGGNIAEMFQSAFSTPIPRWFTSGVSHYVAYGWNAEMDDFIREYVYHQQTDKFARLSPEANTLIGNSIWNFVVQKYGRRSISNILNLARILRNEENSISRTLGIPFNSFILEWRSFYTNMNNNLLQAYVEPQQDFKISGKNRKEVRFTDIKFSPNGKYLAYSSTKSGKFEVTVVNMENQRSNKVYEGGFRIINQELEENLPILSWADTTTLGIVYPEGGTNVLAVKRMGEKGEQKITIPRLSHVQSFAFRRGGRTAVLTGTLNGVSDVFIYNVVRGQIRNVTSDSYDDRDVSYYRGSNQILFSSNRSSDSVYVSGTDEIGEAEVNRFNIFSYDLDFPDSSFRKITNALAIDAKPMMAATRDVYYLSDQQGIQNLYKYSFVDSVKIQVTNFAYGIKRFSYDARKQRLAFISTDHSRDAIYLQTMSEDQNIFTPVTPRKAQETSRLLAELRRERQIQNQTVRDSVIRETVPKILQNPIRREDSIRKGAIDTENYQFKNSQSIRVNTKNYQFEKADENPNPVERSNSFLDFYRNTSSNGGLSGPFNYETRMQTNNLVTSFVIDEIRSFSTLMEIEMNDFLENHRFQGGILIPLSFSQGYDVFGEYEYLKYRIDFKARYYRKSIVERDPQRFLNQRYNLDRFEFGFKLPFNQRFRVELSPFYAQTRYLDSDIRLFIPSNNPAQFEPNIVRRYLGYNLGFIYDNSVVTGTNIHEGTRAKIELESHFKASNEAETFHNLEVDFRHYQRIAKGILVAGRVFFGSYFGSAPKQYLLGGVDNWAFNRSEGTDQVGDPLFFTTLQDNSDVLFNKFVNLRGYNYNTFQGRNVLSASGELRIPINQLLSNKEMRSNFLRNLQFVGFYDIGSSWQDLSPFAESNNRNLEEIGSEGSPFSAVINNFSNPWIQSTGFGIRTMLFGFFSRIDLSFPVVNYQVQNPKFQLSFGYDF